MRADNSIEIFETRRSFLRAPKAGVKQGKRILALGWKPTEMQATVARSEEQPTPVLEKDKRKLWLFRERFYWDDDNLEQVDVYALILQKERQLARKLETAHSLMRAEEGGVRSRTAIPREIRKAVFERDEGKCVECGATFDLAYDHILPFSRGGANTVENLQILCSACNLRKSDSL